MNRYMDLKNNWGTFSRERNAIYGISIISIIIFHFFEDLLRDTSSGCLYYARRIYNRIVGSVGVEIFLFLSGMGLYFSLKKEPNNFRYIKKRISRIFPAYLAVSLPYWFITDIVIKRAGVSNFLADISFISFFTNGNRTFWYVLFIAVAYIVYPFVYKLLNSRIVSAIQFVILLITAMAVQCIPRLTTPTLYSNIEIFLCRFLVFFIGCWAGPEIYKNAVISQEEKTGFYFGAILMFCSFIPVLKSIIEKIGYRFLMCFWSSFLLYFLVIKILPQIPSAVIVFLEKVGKLSYELYLTHVAVRALMNTIGLKTSYLWCYVVCIVLSALCAVGLSRCERRITHVI